MDNSKYNSIFSDIVKKQASVIGLAVSVNIAKKTGNIEINEDGTVTSVTGNPKEVMLSLARGYMKLSGEIAEFTINGILKDHPEIAFS